MDLKGSERILDVGCGIGTLGKLLRKDLGTGGEIVGIDLDQELVKYGNTHWARWSKIHLEVGNAQQISYHEGDFDIVASFGLLEHVSNMPRVISEMIRVLKRPGKLVALSIDPREYIIRPTEKKVRQFYQTLALAMELKGTDLGLVKFRALCHEKKLPVETFTFTMEYNVEITREYIQLVEAAMKNFIKSVKLIEDVVEFSHQWLQYLGWSKKKVRKYVNHFYSINAILDNYRTHIGENFYRKIPLNVYRIQFMPEKKGP